MLNNYMGIISLKERAAYLNNNLFNYSTVAALPVAGRYKVIDFVLSNMVNSAMSNISVFTSNKTNRLVNHLYGGKPWDLDRKSGGLQLFNYGYEDANCSEIEMIEKHIEYIRESKETHVIFSQAYMICNIDFKEVTKQHKQSKNDITVVYKKALDCKENFIGCDVLSLDEDENVVSVGKNKGAYDINNISAEMFIMSKELFLSLIDEAITLGAYKNLKDFIYNSIDRFKVGGYKFDNFLTCINSLKQYYKFNMDCLKSEINTELFFNKDFIYTKVRDEAPSKYTESSLVRNSLIANGCIIEGKVENSIISRRVHVKKGAVIKDSIILQDCIVDENVTLNNVILDAQMHIDVNKELKGDIEFPLIIEKDVV